jgi:hypothetical protein
MLFIKFHDLLIILVYTRLIPTADHNTGNETVQIPSAAAVNIAILYSPMTVYFRRNQSE